MKPCCLRVLSFILRQLFHFNCSHQIAVAYCTAAKIAICDALICPTVILQFLIGLRAQVARRKNKISENSNLCFLGIQEEFPKTLAILT
jgi:hypothetical protein